MQAHPANEAEITKLPQIVEQLAPGIEAILADKGYAHPSTRTELRRRRIRHVIPERLDQIAHRKAKGSKGGRPPGFDPEVYKQRNVVERSYVRLKQWRGIAMRSDKLARNYRAGIYLAATLIWIKTDLIHTP